MHNDFRRHAIGLALEPLRLGVLGAREIGTENEARTVDQKHMMRCGRWPLRCDGGVRLRNDRFGDLVHGFLHLSIARFRWARRRSGWVDIGILHRAVNEEAGTIGTLDLPGWAEIEV